MIAKRIAQQHGFYEPYAMLTKSKGKECIWIT